MRQRSVDWGAASGRCRATLEACDWAEIVNGSIRGSGACQGVGARPSASVMTRLTMVEHSADRDTRYEGETGDRRIRCTDTISERPLTPYGDGWGLHHENFDTQRERGLQLRVGGIGASEGRDDGLGR